jgi:UMF1 family MFS transporter
MLILQFGEGLGLPTVASRLQCSLILMGLWWALFTLPALVFVRDRPLPAGTPRAIAWTIRSSAGDVSRTLRSLRYNLPLALFLLSFLFYNDGIQTVISQASTFALQELQFPAAELMAVILMIQFLALPGSLWIGRSADRYGQKRVLLACLGVWGGVLLIALLVQNKLGFWLLSAAIALVLGGTQSVSRALMALMIPADQNAQYFGFFNLSGKATGFLGTFLFGAIVAITGSSRLAILGMLPLFVIGWLLMWHVQVEPAARSAESANSAGV